MLFGGFDIFFVEIRIHKKGLKTIINNYRLKIVNFSQKYYF
jgi:hypothetical protein